MTDHLWIRNTAITLFCVFVFGLITISIVTCNKPQPLPAVIGERTRITRDTHIVVNAVPLQKIDTVTVVKTVWKTKTTIQDRIIIDTVGYIAISDTIKGKKGTEFIVEYDSYLKNFSVPYLLERPDTTTIITDSIIVERTVKEEENNFWSDVGKLAGGFFGGCLFTTALK